MLLCLQLCLLLLRSGNYAFIKSCSGQCSISMSTTQWYDLESNSVVLFSFLLTMAIPLFTGYPYTADLVALEQCKPKLYGLASDKLSRIVTPLNANVWKVCLQNHPDRLFALYIRTGIQYGFRLGWCRPTPAKSNMISAAAHPSVVAVKGAYQGSHHTVAFSPGLNQPLWRNPPKTPARAMAVDCGSLGTRGWMMVSQSIFARWNTYPSWMLQLTYARLEREHWWQKWTSKAPSE